MLCVLPRRELLKSTLSGQLLKLGQEISSYWYQQVVDQMIFYQRYVYFTCLCFWVEEENGIGSVCTHPSHQKQGLAKKLLKYTKETFLKDAFVLDSKGSKITLLHSSKVALQRYYSHLGWDQTAVIRYGIWRIDTGGDGKTHMCTVRPATITTPDVSKCCTVRFKSCYLKDRSDVDQVILDERIKDKALFVCAQCDVIVAYASVKKYCNRHQLVEFAVADTHLDDPNKSQGCIETYYNMPF